MADVAGINAEQMLVNQALIERIFQCEEAAAALRDSGKKLNDLLVHQFNTREEERKRIARDIHDSLGQNLLVLRIDLVRLHARTARSHFHLHGCVHAALDNLDSTIALVRQLIGDLRPFQLELGLVTAVEWELSKFRRTWGLKSMLSYDPELSEMMLPDEQTVALYRGLQECLDNVVRHSQASLVNVSLEILHNTLLMKVRDNGIGFDAGLARRAGCYGLLGMEERMAALGGSVVVASSPRQGTAVSLSLPFAGDSLDRPDFP
jgi:signal transduction histidine kinase